MAKAVDVPTIFFSVIDYDRQVFTSVQGLNICETRREDSFCGHTILQDDIMVVADAATSPLFHDNPLVVGEPYIGFYAGIPVRSPEGYNRRHFDDILAREWARNQRTGSPLGLIMADIDHFKSYNDEYGHSQGDVCLREVTATLQSEAKRSGDLVFRIGGEELAILLPNTPERGTRELAERARCAVRALGISHPDPQSPGIITLSLGAAVARPGEPLPASPEAFMQEVDALLYQAKSRGRDQLIAADDRP